jgi:hypothetical protein
MGSDGQEQLSLLAPVECERCRGQRFFRILVRRETPFRPAKYVFERCEGCWEAGVVKGLCGGQP